MWLLSSPCVEPPNLVSACFLAGSPSVGWTCRGQESPDLRQIVGSMVARQRLQENFTIGHTLDAGVQEGQDAAVGFGANEPAKALFQGENGLGYLEFGKGVAPVFLQGPDARGHDGVAGYREGQAVNDDAGKLVAGHIHALPEAGSGEKDGMRGVLETFEKHGARRRSLQEQREVEPFVDPLEQVVHLGIAGKQAEGAALA